MTDLNDSQLKTLSDSIKQALSTTEVFLFLKYHHDFNINQKDIINFIIDNNLNIDHMKYEFPDVFRSPVWNIPNFEAVVKFHRSYSSISKYVLERYKIEVGYFALIKRINRENISTEHMTHRNSASIFMTISDEDFTEIVRSSDSLKMVGRKLLARSGRTSAIKKRIKRLNIDTTHFLETQRKSQTRSLNEILQKGTEYNSHALKMRLVEEGILEYKCVKCGNTGIKNDKPLTLQLNHINGDHCDNRLENLEILCPGCHTQTETYGSKNKAYIYSDSEYIDRFKTITKEEFQKRKEIKQQIKQDRLPTCLGEDCNKKVSEKKCKRCFDCNKKHVASRSVKPSLEILKRDFNELKTFRAVGKKYNVSDNAVRKWYRSYGEEPPRILKPRK